MPNFTQYAYTDIKAVWAVVQTSSGEVELELSAFDTTYTINSIPSARLKIAVGSTTTGDGQSSIAEAHAKAAKLERRNRVVVYGLFSGESYKAESGLELRSWPGEKIVLFDGYINRPSYQRSTGAASLLFYADHWLSDLAITTKLSYTLHPRSAGDLLLPITGPSGTGMLKTHKIELKNDEVFTDLWAGGIKKVFRRLMELDLINYEKFSLFNALEQNNEIAGAALDRMDDASRINVVPLHLENGFRDMKESQALFKSGLALSILSIHNGVSVWETLLKLAADYRYAIIPVPETATVAPLTALPKTVLVTIGADEYENISDSGTPEVRGLPIRGVALFSSSAMLTFNASKEATPEGLVGLFDVADGAADGSEVSQGQLLARRAPLWCHPHCMPKLDKSVHVNLPAFGKYPPSRTNTDGQAEVSTVPRERIRRSFLEKAQLLARSIFISEVFLNRRCTISGRLRLDIAPGTPVQLELLGKNVPYYQADSPLWGLVQSVTVSIDAERGRAGTSFLITHLHTQAERELPNLVVDKHPMYTQVWTGTELVRNGG